MPLPRLFGGTPQQPAPSAWSQIVGALAERIRTPAPPPAATASPAQETRETILERMKAKVETFDEDKEGIGAKIVRKLFTLAAYLLPFLVAYAIGKEIGDYYGGSLNLSDGWSLGMHTLSWGGEAALAMMVISTATAWRRFKKDPGAGGKLLSSGIAFVVFTLASCSAQWVIAFNHIHPTIPGDYIPLVFRVSMAPCVDIAALLWLSIMGLKSLKTELAELQQKKTAIIELTEAEIAITDAQEGANQRREQMQQALETQKRFAALVMELSEISGQGMVELAKMAVAGGANFRRLGEPGQTNGATVPTKANP